MLRIVQLHTVSCHNVCVDDKYDNFIVGLTNISPNVSTVTPWNYDVCGQYPGAVPSGTTVSLYCRENLPSFRYVIVQLPLTDNLVTCEVEVLVRGMRMSIVNIHF